jgi:protein phosphatase PTC7
VDGRRVAVSAAGVGDVSVLVLAAAPGRDARWRVAARLAHGMRGFNYPEQLGYAPGHAAAFATPADAREARYDGLGETLVLAASDGLLDNMFEDELLDLLSAAPRAPCQCGGGSGAAACERVDALAARVADAALAHSVDRRRQSPFYKAAAEHDIVWSAGGRPDDITVVLALGGEEV